MLNISRPLRVRRSPAARLSVLCLVVVASCACAARPSGADRSAELLSSVPPRAAGCAAEGVPNRLPSVAAILDSASLAANLSELQRGEPLAAGYVLLTLGFDREGHGTRRDLIEHDVSPLLADSIQKLVFAARQRVRESEEEWGVRLRIDLGEQPALRVGRREFCPPLPRDSRLDAAMQTVNPARARFRRGVRERTVLVRAEVNESGFVTSARILRSELSGSAIEREIAQYLRRFLFNPATVDGIPTVGWVELPVRVQG